MAAIVFPLAPTVNQQYTAGGRTYTFTGESWSTGVSSVPPGVGQQVAAPNASGFTVVVAANVGVLMLNPLTAMKAGTVKLPPAPTQGQRIIIGTSKTILRLTVQDSAGVPTNVVNHPEGIGVGGRLEFIWSTVTNKWICIDGFKGKVFLPPRAADFGLINGASGFATYDQTDAMIIDASPSGNANFMTLLTQPVINVNGANGVGASYILCWDVIESFYAADAQSAPAIGIILKDNTTGGHLFISSGLVQGTQNHCLLGQYWLNPTTPDFVFAQRVTKYPAKALKLIIRADRWEIYMGDGFNWEGGIWSYYIPGYSVNKVDAVGIGVRRNNDFTIHSVTQFGALYGE